MITEIWVASDLLKKHWDDIPVPLRESIIVRAEFDEVTKEQIKFHFKEIALLKQKDR